MSNLLALESFKLCVVYHFVDLFNLVLSPCPFVEVPRDLVLDLVLWESIRRAIRLTPKVFLQVIGGVLLKSLGKNTQQVHPIRWSEARVEDLFSGNLDELCFHLAVSNQVAPNLTFHQSLRVANNDQKVPGPSDCDVQPPLVNQETQTALQIVGKVTPHTVEYYNVFFPPLESIDSINFKSVS